MSYEIYLGDCAQVMRGWPENSVDALVTDPPSGIGFMGRDWDSDKGGWQQWVDWLAGVMREALRVMKPGAHGLVWALPRTSHWTGSALQASGFEIRDRFTHLFGTGFPKSKNLGDGVGTALKPAVEDWWLVRKPLAEKSITANLKRWGVGGLNIDNCLIRTEDNLNGGAYSGGERAPVTGDTRTGAAAGMYGEHGRLGPDDFEQPEGRWPAHLVLDEFAAAELDHQTTHLRVGGNLKGGEGGDRRVVSPLELGPRGPWQSYGDSGGASRFFFKYVAKPGRSEREFGCEALPLKSAGEVTDREDGSAGLKSPRAGAGRTGGARNHHPTLKPIALMRYFCRLIAPKGGIVFDPFMGSGTTGIAALREGFDFIGIEQEFQYLVIAAARLGAAEGEQHEEGESGSEPQAGERNGSDAGREHGGSDGEAAA